ncbi:MAG: ATP-binding protein [Sulfitobacter sp.]
MARFICRSIWQSIWVLTLITCLWAQAGRAQDVVLPENFYDPQLLAYGDWMVYTVDGSRPDIDALDDADWVKVKTKSVNAPQGKVSWYRIDFTIGWHYRTRDLGIYLGMVEQAHEVYLNGRLIGKGGFLSPNGIDAAGKPSLMGLPKLGMWYSFMNLSRSNSLVVAVEGLTEPSAFAVDAIQIDDRDRLILTARSVEASLKILQGAAISILLLIALFCGFLFVSGFRGPSNLRFGLFVLVAAILILLDSLIFYDLGGRFAWVERVLAVGKLLCTVLFCRLVQAEILGQLGRGISLSLGVTLTAIGLIAVAMTPISLPFLDLTTDVVAVVLVLYTMLRALKAQGGFTFQVMLMWALAAVLLFAYLYQFIAASPWHALSTIQISYLLTTFTFLFLIAQRYQDMSRHLGNLSERLVTVRDLERARMARDMHDGLGQGIAAVGLHLKILAADKADARFGNLTQSIDDLNVGVVEIIENLRPSILHNQTLGAAIERHLERTLAATEIGYDCAVNKKIELPFALKEQLFRIYQESLNNAIKHAECFNISVEMNTVGRRLKLSISDDGQGFNVGGKRDLGLGLSTMRERASLANAVYILESALGRGTKIKMEVTLDD